MQNNSSAIPYICGASARILCSVLDIAFQERYEPVGRSSEEKNKNDQRLKKQIHSLQGKTEGTGVVSSLTGKDEVRYSFQIYRK